MGGRGGWPSSERQTLFVSLVPGLTSPSQEPKTKNTAQKKVKQQGLSYLPARIRPRRGVREAGIGRLGAFFLGCWMWHGGNATFLASPAIIGRVWGAWGVPDGDTEAQGWGRDAGDTVTPCRGAGKLGGSLSGRSQKVWEQRGRAGPAPSLLPPPGTRLGTSRPERPRGRRVALEPTLPLAPPRLRTLPRNSATRGGPRGATTTSRAGDGTGDTPGGPQNFGDHDGARGRGRGRRAAAPVSPGSYVSRAEPWQLLAARGAGMGPG